jgi:hypothetical protein
MGLGGCLLMRVGMLDSQYFIGGGSAELMRLDNLGRLGIGNSAPSSLLHISGPGGSSTSPIVTATTGTNYIGQKFINTGGSFWLAIDNSTGSSFLTNTAYSRVLWSDGAYPICFSTNSVERVRIDASGRVGIGTSSPGHRLSLADSISTVYSPTGLPSPIVGVANTDTTVGAASLQIFTVAGAGGTSVIYHGAVGGGGSATGQYVIGRRTGTSTYAESLRIDSSGRVGIGTTSPTSLLHCSQSNNGITSLSVINGNTGTSARSDIIAASDSADIRIFATSAAYTGVSGWADAGVLSTSSNSSNGLILNAQAGGIKFAYGATERARIDTSGRFLVGTSTARSNFFNTTASAALQIEGQGGAGDSRRVAIISNDNTALAGGNLVLAHQRSGSVGGNTIVNINDIAGRLSYQGNDGAQFVEAASINCEVDGTPGANDMPGRLVFSTTADGGSSPSERLRITSAGLVGIGSSAPVKELTVVGDIAVGNSGNSGYRFYNASPTAAAFRWYIANDSNDNFLKLYRYDSSGAFAAQVLTVDTSNRVGIGTTSPAVELEVSSPSNTQILINCQNDTGNSQLWFGDSSSDEAGVIVYRHADNSMAFEVNDTEALRIDSSKRLLVGTSSSSDNVRAVFTGNSLSATDGGVVHLRRGGSAVSVNTHIGTLGFAGGEGLYASIITQADATPGTGDSPGRLVFSTTADGASSPTERMRIDSSGRLLVGTTSARTNVFTIAPRIQYEGSGAAENRFVSFGYSSADAAGPGIAIFKTRAASAGGNTAVVNADMLGELRFCGADGTNIIRGAAIGAFVDGTPGADDMPGRLVFSTTADGASSPTERMRITATGRTSCFSSEDAVYSRTAAAAGTSIAVFVGAHTATNNSNGTASSIIWSNGNIVNTNNSYGAISDIKLKENIVDANSQWDDLKALQVRNYNFKEGQTHTQIGLVAQEVELVSPGLVSESPDRDAEGNDLGTVTKSVNYSVLYMKAVKALQEAMERID